MFNINVLNFTNGVQFKKVNTFYKYHGLVPTSINLPSLHPPHPIETNLVLSSRTFIVKLKGTCCNGQRRNSNPSSLQYVWLLIIRLLEQQGI